MKKKILTILLLLSIIANLILYKKYNFETRFRAFYVWVADNHEDIYRAYFEPEPDFKPNLD